MKNSGVNNDAIPNTNLHDSGYDSGVDSVKSKGVKVSTTDPNPKLSVKTQSLPHKAEKNLDSKTITSRQITPFSAQTFDCDLTLKLFKKNFRTIRQLVNEGYRSSSYAHKTRPSWMSQHISSSDARYPIAFTRVMRTLAPDKISASLNHSAENAIKDIESYINLTNNTSDSNISLNSKVPDHQMIDLIEAIATYYTLLGQNEKADAYITAGLEYYTAKGDIVPQLQDAKFYIKPDRSLLPTKE